MATPMGDGGIILHTKVDTSGAEKGTKELKSQAASLAAEYRKAGMTQSEAMKKAWQEVRKTADATEEASKSADRFGKQSKKTSKTIRGAFKDVNISMSAIAGKLANVFALYKLVDFGKQAIDLASDLQEVQNVVDVAFGEMSYKIEEFTKTSIENFGLSRLSAKQTASGFAAAATGIGILLGTGTDMAIELTKLSADLSSFYNKDQEQARIALQSVFTGETETLKQFNVFMTEVNLQEYARQKGITKSIKLMTQQEKVMLRYNYVLEQTRLVQGDYARTADSWANRTKTLNEQWKEMQATFGEVFINIGVLILPAIEKLVSLMQNLANLAKEAAENLYPKSADANKEQEKAIKGSANNQKKLTKEVKATNKEVEKTLLGFDNLNILQSKSGKEAGAGGLITPPQKRDKKKGESPIKKVSDELKELMKTIGKCLAAVGVILLAFGHIGWGIAFIIAGAAAFSVSAASTSDGLAEFKTKMGEFLGWISLAFIAIGIILILAGKHALGIGFIVVGAVGVITAIVINRNSILEFVKQNSAAIAGISVAIVAIGIILCFTGNIPLGIGFILAGGMELVELVSFNWDWVVSKVKIVGTAIKDFFLDVWEGIKLGFKSMVNGIIEFANIWIDRLNALLLPIRAIVYGIAKAFGSDISFGNVKIPHIPYLAQGAVIPPNREFMAVLGDQKHGNNIEAPENLIRKIVREETGGKNLTIKATGSMAQLIQLLHLELADENTRATVF